MTDPPVRKSRIHSNPDLLIKEALAAAVFIGASFMVSALLDAPLEAPADLDAAPSDNVKAPWIFVGIQFMLVRMDPLLAGILIPVGALALICLAAFTGEGSRESRLISRCLFHGILAAGLALTVAGYYF
jgi:hypothetical protein